MRGRTQNKGARAWNIKIVAWEWKIKIKGGMNMIRILGSQINAFRKLSMWKSLNFKKIKNKVRAK